MSGTLTDKLSQLFSHAKSAPARTRAGFKIGKPDGEPFIDRKHYMQVLVNEMYLAKEREWWVRYAPVALVATTYLYGTENQTAPVVVGPALLKQYSQDVDGTIIRNAPVTSLHPYQGGAVTFTVIFTKVEKANNADKVLDVLEGFAEVASPLAPAIPFSSYLKIAGNVMTGARVLFDLPKTQPIVAYRETINPQISQVLEPMHLVLIDTQGLTDEEKRKFRVRDSQLYYGDAPYRENDFVLLEIAQGSKRTDERTLDFYPLWVQTRKLGLQAARQDGLWQEAKHHFNTLKVAINESSDLTEPDARRLTAAYLNELKEIRQSGAEEQELKIEERSADTLREYQQVARQLDELDEL